MYDKDTVIHPDIWRGKFEDLVNTPWEYEDGNPLGELGTALIAAYKKLENHISLSDPEVALDAVLQVAAQQRGHYSIDTLNAVVETLQIEYKDREEAGQQYIDDHFPGFQISWIKEDAGFWDEVKSESEIWFKFKDYPQVYVFTKLP